MLCVGIDVSKNKHDVAVINTEGEILLEHLQISNDREGFDNLHQTLSQLINKTANDTRIALEDTGHYSFNILSFLRTMGYQVSTYNPLLIKEFAKTITLRKTKTDKKDALTIAKKFLVDQDPERFDTDEQIQELKYLTRHRERLIQKQTDLKVQYTKVLDLISPELASVLSKMGTHNQSTYDLLKKYPSPKKIQRARPTSLAKIKHLNKENIDKIQDKAKTTIGTCSIALEFELLQTINLIEYFKSVIKEVDTEINVLMVKIDSPIFQFLVFQLL